MKIYKSFITFICLGVLFSFTQSTPKFTSEAKNIEEMRKLITVSLSTNSKRYANNENMFFNATDLMHDKGEKETPKYPASQCESQPSYMYYGLVIAFDRKNAYWNDGSFFRNDEFKNNFKNIAGKDPIKEIKKMKSGAEFRFFNGDALENAMDKLLPQTNDQLQNIPYQKIYDITLKDYFAESCEIIKIALQDRKLFNKLSADYLKKAMKNEGFDGQNYTYDCVEKIFKQEIQKKCLPNKAEMRILGMLMRRQCDGSLKNVLNSLKKVLQRFDNATFEKYKNAF